MDGLLENDSVLRLREHSTDTHGYIEDLFGLCYLLGYSFMPRIRDLADQQLYRIDRDAVYPNLVGILGVGEQRSSYGTRICLALLGGWF